jgi:hypothetical protein
MSSDRTYGALLPTIRPARDAGALQEDVHMKRLLAILAIAAAGVVAACGQGSTSSGGVESVPAVSVEAPSTGASEAASPAESMAPEASPSPSS